MTKTFDIYWNDLTEECQNELDKFLGLEKGDDNNWTFIPITSLTIEEDDSEVEDRIQ